jgi:prophage regulatory protein
MSETVVNICQVLRRKQVSSFTGLSAASIYDRLDPKSPRYDPNFPKQIRLGANSVGWLEHEIQAWIEGRVRLSRASTSPDS